MIQAYQVIFAHELNKLKDSGGLAEYERLRPALLASGILDFLRLTSGPFVPGMGGNVQEAAHAASFSQGYHKCLDDLKYFSIIQDTVEVKKIAPVPDYGGTRMAIARGDIKPDGYESFAKSTKPTKSNPSGTTKK